MSNGGQITSCTYADVPQVVIWTAMHERVELYLAGCKAEIAQNVSGI